MMTRRAVLLAAAANAFDQQAFAQAKLEMAMQGYIFQQHAERLKKPLGDVVEEMVRIARAAGFRHVELTDSFFAPEMRERLLGLLKNYGLSMPSVYVGGALHEEEAAKKTMARVMATLDICAPFGCKAVVNNPDPKPGGDPKTDAELKVEADALNRVGRALSDRGAELRVHHHTPQLENHAREWRFILRRTDPANVRLCVDVDWAYECGFDPVAFLEEAGERVSEIHVRSAKNKVWLEDVEDSDIDYRSVAAYLRKKAMRPLVIVELAYRPETQVTRGLEDDLRRSRKYVGEIFGLR